MRSDLVHAAMTNVSSRYLLVNSASKATRLFHRPQTQVSETVNEVLNFFHNHDPVAAEVRDLGHERRVEVSIVPQFDMRY